jgi:hypothetical protein
MQVQGGRSKGEKMKNVHQGGSSAIYGLGFIGAAIYFISQASSFWLGVVGFLKAIVWPVFFVYEAFKFFAK